MFCRTRMAVVRRLFDKAKACVTRLVALDVLAARGSKPAKIGLRRGTMALRFLFDLHPLHLGNRRAEAAVVCAGR
jgi:hypothetical protein